MIIVILKEVVRVQQDVIYTIVVKMKKRMQQNKVDENFLEVRNNKDYKINFIEKIYQVFV